jgi:prepilin-type N-terminal cleavage/methylation domain-containing protein
MLICRHSQGFTLVELLIAVALLGMLATFTIPKILNAQQGNSYKHKVREAAAMVSDAYQKYQIDTGASGSTGISSLTPYMNFVALDTNNVIDNVQGQGSYNCDSTHPCLRLHNGAMLNYKTVTFGGIATTNAVWVHIDPDGVLTDATTNNPGKAVPLFLYYQNGRIMDEGNILSGTRD